jgi:hypothetical protein
VAAGRKGVFSRVAAARAAAAKAGRDRASRVSGAWASSPCDSTASANSVVIPHTSTTALVSNLKLQPEGVKGKDTVWVLVRYISAGCMVKVFILINTFNLFMTQLFLGADLVPTFSQVLHSKFIFRLERARFWTTYTKYFRLFV